MNKNFIEPNAKKLKELRKITKLKQSSIPEAFKEFKLKTSLRNYQRAEKGEPVSQKFLISLAQFFDNYLKKHHGFVDSITINDLTKQNHNLKGSSKKKNIPLYNTETCFLYQLKSEEELSSITKRSYFRKIFYKVSLPAKSKEAKIVSDILRDIHTVKKESNKGPKKSASESYYSGLDQEIEAINNVSHFEENIKELSKLGIFLYAGNFQISRIEAVGLPNTIQYEPHPAYENQTIQLGTFQAGIGKKDYAIFCFYQPKQQSLLFSYQNYWHLDKLNELIKKVNFSYEGYDIDADQQLGDHIQHEYDYSSRIDKDKVSITAETASQIESRYKESDYTPGEDPRFDEILRESGKTYVEYMEDCESMYGQMEVDRIRGK